MKFSTVYIPPQSLWSAPCLETISSNKLCAWSGSLTFNRKCAKFRHCHEKVRWPYIIFSQRTFIDLSVLCGGFLFGHIYRSKSLWSKTCSFNFFYINICFKTDFAISPYMFVLCCSIDVQLPEWRLLPTRTIISQTSCRRSDPPRDNARSFDHLHIQRSRWLNHGLKFHGVKFAKVAANLHLGIQVYQGTIGLE